MEKQWLTTPQSFRRRLWLRGRWSSDWAALNLLNEYELCGQVPAYQATVSFIHGGSKITIRHWISCAGARRLNKQFIPNSSKMSFGISTSHARWSVTSALIYIMSGQFLDCQFADKWIREFGATSWALLFYAPFMKYEANKYRTHLHRQLIFSFYGNALSFYINRYRN